MNNNNIDYVADRYFGEKLSVSKNSSIATSKCGADNENVLCIWWKRISNSNMFG